MKMLYGDRFLADLNDCVTYCTVDPAGGTAPKDANHRTNKWGFAVVSVSTDSQYFVLDMWSEYLNEAMFMERLWEIDAKWAPYRIGIEKTQHLDAYIRLEFARKNRSLNLVKLDPKGRRKERRIQALSALLPNMYFNSKIVANIQQRLQRWYTEQEIDDDDLDALAYVIDIAKAPTPQQIKEQRAARAHAEEQDALKSLPPNQRPEWEAWLKYVKASAHGRPVGEQFMDMYDY